MSRRSRPSPPWPTHAHKAAQARRRRAALRRPGGFVAELARQEAVEAGRRARRRQEVAS